LDRVSYGGVEEKKRGENPDNNGSKTGMKVAIGEVKRGVISSVDLLQKAGGCQA